MYVFKSFKDINVGILIRISLKFVPKGPINNIPTRRQAFIWTNDGLLTDTYMRHSASMS